MLPIGTIGDKVLWAWDEEAETPLYLIKSGRYPLHGNAVPAAGARAMFST